MKQMRDSHIISRHDLSLCPYRGGSGQFYRYRHGAQDRRQSVATSSALLHRFQEARSELPVRSEIYLPCCQEGGSDPDIDLFICSTRWHEGEYY
jgi:hypothetical protein